MKGHFLPVLLGLVATQASYAALPVVSNVTSSQRAGTKLVDISYDVADADGDLLKIRVEISSDGGTNYSVPAFTFTGDYGDNVAPGAGKAIVWDAAADWDGEYSDAMRVKVIASDTNGLPGLEWGNEVPPGGFLMGQDGGAEGGGPSRHVNIPWSYWLSKYEITNEQYAEYLNIALAAGEVYRVGTTEIKAVSGAYSGVPGDSPLIHLGDHLDLRWSVNKVSPVTGEEQFPVSVTWYGALAFALHYGYDLPTTAEWEKAARGPDHDDEDEHLVYPWGNSLSGGNANYAFNGGTYNYSKSPVGYFDGNQTPFGPDMANDYGLYDVVGNVREWSRSTTLTVESYPQTENLSAGVNSYVTTGSRILRGGAYNDSSGNTHKTYYRENDSQGAYRSENGFRVVRREP